jgi:hypothetical protein
MIYRMGGRSGGGTPLSPICTLFNPETPPGTYMKVLEFKVVTVGTTTGITNIICNKLKSTVATRGSPFATLTPDIDNDCEGELAPPSGAVLDVGPYSVNPTGGSGFVGNYEWMEIDGLSFGQGYILMFDPSKEIGPGEGLSFLVGFGAPNWPACDVTYVWEE